MKALSIAAAIFALQLAVGGVVAHAQVIPDSIALRNQRALDSLSVEMEAMKARVDALTQAPTPAAGRGTYMNVSFVGLTNFGWSTEEDVPSLQLGDHDPRVRGFTIPNAEMVLDAIADPYFQGFTSIVYKLDEEGETGVELEEMFIQTTSLPANLQLKVGQFFTEFGRQNPQHPHAWAFADQPLVLNRFLGPEGLRGQGMRLAWLFPTPYYLEGLVSVLNSAGGTTFSFRGEESADIHLGNPTERVVEGPSDLLFASRLATSFDLSDTQTVLAGASAALGPNNAGPATETQIYGVDVYWKWKAPTAYQGFPFVSLQTEALFRNYDVDWRPMADDPVQLLPAESLQDRGVYSQLLWGIKPRIVAGLRGEYVDAKDAAFESDLRATRYRVTPNLTWFPTEFSKFRVQYNYDHRDGIGSDHSLWLQLEVLMGAHAAHTF